MTSIPLKSLVGIVASNSDATRKRLTRYNVASDYVTTHTGKIRMVSLEDLQAKGLVDETQAARLIEASRGHDGQGDPFPLAGLSVTKTLETDKLFCSDAVQKGFGASTPLSATEVEVLDRLCPGWERMKVKDRVTAIIKATGCSRSYLYRDHREDGRKLREKAFEKLTQAQRDAMIKHYLFAKTRLKFFELCRNDESLPHIPDRTMYRIAAQLETSLKDELTLINKGSLALRQASEPILRDKTYLKPLQVIIGDFTRIDRIIRWHDGTLCTPYACVWQDWRTSMIVGVALTQFPNALGAKTSLFNCFINYGIPEIAFMDNGKEFKAYKVAGEKLETLNYRLDFVDDVERDVKSFEYKGILPALGVASLRAIVKNPRSKPVERTFGRGGFTDWAKQFGDWVGSKYWLMPETIAKAIAKHNQGKAYKEPLSGKFIEFSDLHSLAASVCEFIEFYNNRASSGFGMDGKSPQQLWNELTVENPPRRAPVQKIAFHFLDGDTRKVRNTGHIEFKKHFFYRSEAFWKHRLETVYIRFNPVDGFWWHRADKKQFEFLPKLLLVFDIEGQYIGEATFVERQDPLNADVKSLMAKQRKTVSEAKSNVKALLQSSVPSAPTLDVVEAVKELEEKTNRRDAEDAEKEAKRLQKKFGIISEI
ncbi:MAG: hypothetical protein EPO24_07645 [Bacteroidetes bacterium]|nr:MAG: hypothetical protein EPO24_07645 [Bacteroidota bacterium]